jgi:hypothetical protein
MKSFFDRFRKQPPSTDTADSEMEKFNRDVKAGWDFLTLVNERFSERERVRDRSHLNASYDQIARALMKIFLTRDEIRRDVRELFMRLATFQDLGSDMRDTAIPLQFPPLTEGGKLLNKVITDERVRFWSRMEQLEIEYPSGSLPANADIPGLLITVEDRGWRPESPFDVLGNSNA